MPCWIAILRCPRGQEAGVVHAGIFGEERANASDERSFQVNYYNVLLSRQPLLSSWARGWRGAPRPLCLRGQGSCAQHECCLVVDAMSYWIANLFCFRGQEAGGACHFLGGQGS